MKLKSVGTTKSQVTAEEENTKLQSIDQIEITPHQRKDIDYITYGRREHFRNETTKRSACIFQTLPKHFGYRCFVDQVFKQDVLIPDASLDCVEVIAESWTKGNIE